MLRVFIDIDLPPYLKDILAEKMSGIKNKYNPPLRFTTPAQWRLTLVFLGHQEEKIIKSIEGSMINAASRVPKPLKISFEKITYGPPGPRARMIWVTTTQETSAVLGKLKRILEDELEKTGLKWQREYRPFHGHITLSRFPIKSLKELPALHELFNFDFEVKEMDLMKSTLKREGSLYEKLFTVAL